MLVLHLEKIFLNLYQGKEVLSKMLFEERSSCSPGRWGTAALSDEKGTEGEARDRMWVEKTDIKLPTTAKNVHLLQVS